VRRAHHEGDGLRNLRRRLEQEGAVDEHCLPRRRYTAAGAALRQETDREAGKMTNILLVEDSKISRETIESHIARSPDYLLLASIENAANAEIACMNGKVDLILMDVCTADGRVRA
jgi:hypothetical protein